MKKFFILIMLFVLSGCNYKTIELNDNTLSTLYKDYFDIGAAVTSFNLDKLGNEYTTITAEYEMKWDQIELSEGVYNFEKMDIIANYARDNNLLLRGHTIIWYQTMPNYIKEIDNLNLSINEKIELCLSYVEVYYETIYNRYGDVLDCFDVVNEVISDSNNPLELYRSNDPFYMMFDYNDEYFEYFIKEVYKIVEEISPNVKRYYNDYFMLNNYIKRNKAIEFIKKINEDEILIEGIGAQSHIDISITQDEVRDALNSFSKLNIEFSFTELDISVYTNESDSEVNYNDVELQLARAYNNIFSVAREYKSMVSNITFWGVDDSMTWLDTNSRKDYPLLFDVDGNKKYAYEVISNFGGSK